VVALQLVCHLQRLLLPWNDRSRDSASHHRLDVVIDPKKIKQTILGRAFIETNERSRKEKYHFSYNAILAQLSSLISFSRTGAGVLVPKWKLD
jgi:hypothetical protein